MLKIIGPLLCFPKLSIVAIFCKLSCTQILPHNTFPCCTAPRGAAAEAVAGNSNPQKERRQVFASAKKRCWTRYSALGKTFLLLQSGQKGFDLYFLLKRKSMQNCAFYHENV